MFPLTMDCPINPFRVSTSRAGKSDFLLHAIMAVSSQHLAKKTNRVELSLHLHSHRSKAMHLFTQALCQSDPCTLLDALLILVSLDVSIFISGWLDQLILVAYSVCPWYLGRSFGWCSKTPRSGQSARNFSKECSHTSANCVPGLVIAPLFLASACARSPDH